jgi:hypothetical protein
MGSTTVLGRRRAAALVAAATLGTAGFLLACATGGEQHQQLGPGMYSLTGWNAWNADINGEVGHRLYVNGPTANCKPSGNWNANYRLNSGSLPPGMSIDNGMNIVGIPAERGHWILTLELYNVECGGNYYKGLTQELRFHITGSGRVIR